MMTALWMFLAALCVLGPLIALHEWGHYIVARLCGVKVLTYSIGFGKRIFGWTSQKTGIEYRIGAIPLGGYVKMLDEREGGVRDDQKHLAFNHQHPLKKIAIVAAGPLMNFIIAIVLFAVLFMQPSEQLNTTIGQITPNSPAHRSSLVVGDKIVAIDGKSVQTWEDVNYALANRMGETGTITVQTVSVDNAITNNTNTNNTDGMDTAPKTTQVPIRQFMQQNSQDSPIHSLGALPYRPIITPIIAQVVPDGVAEQVGMQVGDKVVAIDGKPMNNWLDIADTVRNSPNQKLDIEVLRDGRSIHFDITPKQVKQAGENIGQIGVQVAYDGNIPPEYRMTVQHGIGEAVGMAFTKTYDLAMMTVNALKKMVLGQIGTENISGPISIAQVSKTSFEIGWQQVLSTAGIISLSLAVMNLLPIPILDGGHLVFYTYELIFGRPISERVWLGASKIGMLLLLGFMVLAINNDIWRFFGS